MSVLSGSVPNYFVKVQSYQVWFLQILGNFGLKPAIQQCLWTFRSVAAVLHCFLGVFEMFRSTNDVFDVIHSKSWCTHYFLRKIQQVDEFICFWHICKDTHTFHFCKNLRTYILKRMLIWWLECLLLYCLFMNATYHSFRGFC